MGFPIDEGKICVLLSVDYIDQHSLTIGGYIYQYGQKSVIGKTRTISVIAYYPLG